MKISNMLFVVSALITLIGFFAIVLGVCTFPILFVLELFLIPAFVAGVYFDCEGK
jgi:hypothetical protein